MLGLLLAKQVPMATVARRRLIRDLKKLQSDPPAGCMYFFDLCIWQPIGLVFKYTIPLCEKDGRWDSWYGVRLVHWYVWYVWYV